MQAEHLTEGFEADARLGDKAYDTEASLQHTRKQGLEPIIPPTGNRSTLRDYASIGNRCGLLSRIHSCISRAGRRLPHAMPKRHLPF